jgi:hypothetical protein
MCFHIKTVMNVTVPLESIEIRQQIIGRRGNKNNVIDIGVDAAFIFMPESIEQAVGKSGL